jgi:RNA polymerase sigma factor (TIGR02999 family)
MTLPASLSVLALEERPTASVRQRNCQPRLRIAPNASLHVAISTWQNAAYAPEAMRTRKQTDAQDTGMSEITELLGQAANGSADSLNAVFARLHAELKMLARSRIHAMPNQTLTATSLVNELYLKLMGAQKLELSSRQHFFACAGAAMRHILVDAARASSAEKRGGALEFVTLDQAADAIEAGTHSEILALDAAMEDLGQIDPALLELVHLRFFAGLSMEALAELTGRSIRSLHRDWACARDFLNARLSG